MTVREYLSAMLSKFMLGQKDIDLIILNQGLKGDEEVKDTKALKTAVYREMSMILPAANVSEGQFSVSWNLEALRLWYSSLCRELGQEDLLNPAPKVSDKSNRW